MVDPGKNFLGQRGFPTPDSLPETSACRTFLVPGNDDWLGLLMGAVMVLREEWAYYQWGSFTPAETAAKWQEIIDATYAASIDETCTLVPAPYWDDSNGDDTSDEAPADSQDWYGVWDGETFVEAISYWAVTAFLATGISEGAAIEFITPLRTFRLQMKANPHGAKLLIFMDSNIVQLIDLFSATDQVVSVDIISPGSTLMLVHTGDHNSEATPDANGNYTVDIIRKELTENEVIPSNQRYNSECDCVQFSPDNGTTWVDVPELDPRHSNAFRYPVLSTDDPRCDAAANMVKWIKDFLDRVTDSLGDAAEAFQVANIALDFFTLITGGTSVLLDLIVGLGEALTGIGYTALLAAMTSDQYDLLLCIFYCNETPDGTVDADHLGQIETNITEQLNTTAAIIVNLVLGLQGEVGLSNAGSIGSETGTCDDCNCDWCYEWTDFSDWTIIQGTTAGGGLNATLLADPPSYYNYLSASYQMPDEEINQRGVTVTFTRTDGTFDAPTAVDRLWHGSDSGGNRYATVDAPDNTSPWVDETAFDAGNLIFGLTMSAGYGNGAPPGGLLNVSSYKIHGIGVIPALLTGGEFVDC